MKFFDWLSSEQKDSLAEAFITHSNYISVGKSLFGWFTEPLKLIFIGGAFVYPEWVKENALLSGLGVFFIYILFPDAVGWWWDAKHYIRKQTVWGNKRNDMKEQLDRIEALLSESGKINKDEIVGASDTEWK